MPASTRAYVGLCVASVGWASAFLFGKVVLAEIGALPAAAWRYGLAALVLLPFAARRREAVNIRLVWRPLAIMVVCGGVLYPWAFLAALQRTSATNTSLLIALNPALTYLLAPLVGESWTRHGLVGIALALIGAALVITHGDLAVLTRLTPAHAGDLLALGAAAIWATFNLAARGVVAHLPHARTNAIVYGLGCLMLCALAAPEHPWQQVINASLAALGSLAAMALLSSVLAGQLFLSGVHRIGVSRTVVFIYLVPVLTAAAATLVLGEPLLPAQLVGGGAVLAGVWVTSRAAPPPVGAPVREQMGVEVGEPVA
jgi:drug/metabolite transporter (DMT)-like permease